MAPHTLLRRLVQGSPMALWLLVGVARLPWAGLFDQQPAPGPERPELMFLYVDQALRSGGAGRQLVLLTESAVRQRGPSELTVMTADDPANRALAFYRGLGYVREATVRKYGKAFALFRRTLA